MVDAADSKFADNYRTGSTPVRTTMPEAANNIKARNFMEDLIKSLLTNPEEIPEIINEMGGELKPIIAAVFAGLASIVEEYSKNKDLPKYLAEVKKNKYDAYLEAGFTADQAMAFLLSSELQTQQYIKNNLTSVSK